jgi:hypothetical protein
MAGAGNQPAAPLLYYEDITHTKKKLVDWENPGAMPYRSMLFTGRVSADNRGL